MTPLLDGLKVGLGATGLEKALVALKVSNKRFLEPPGREVADEVVALTAAARLLSGRLRKAEQKGAFMALAGTVKGVEKLVDREGSALKVVM